MRTAAARRASADAQGDRELLIVIRALSGVLTGGYGELAVRLNMSEPTLRRRMKKPGSLTLDELRALTRLQQKELGGSGQWTISA